VAHLNIVGLGIEFRTGRHQSVLPPSVIVAEEKTEYRWLVSPFDCPPPPLPDRILSFYLKHAADPKNKAKQRPHQQSKPRFPYRDDRDYVLRYFDLLKEARDAGVEFLFETPDRNGNVPCYVPAELRGGDDDLHPSGVFNIRNGVLRDFGTGKNHLFFNMLAAVTGEPWQQIFDRYEAQAAPLAGRPHSRRISHPVPSLTDETKISLDEARTNLTRYYQEQLNRPPMPKVLHLIKGPPGLGKTYGMCKTLAETNTKAIILTLENELADRHLSIIRHPGGGKAATRMPVLRETPCPYPDQYEATRRRGFAPSQSYPCRQCEIGLKNCPYLLAFSSLEKADQLCAAAIYHTHDGFYQAYGNAQRPIVVFDENSIDQLLEPVQYNIDQWLAWGEMLRRWEEDQQYQGYPPTKQLFALIEWLDATAQDFLTTLDAKFVPYAVPKELQDPSTHKIGIIQDWLDKAAYKQDNRSVHNLYNAASYLLTHPDAAIILERITKKDEDVVVVRFRKNNPLPEDREVFLLDATANEDLIRAIAPGWEIKVWDCPSIEQKGTVVQIMDYDVSRHRIKKEVARHDAHNPAWTVQVIDYILERYGPAPIITFKDVANPESDILSKLTQGNKINFIYNYPCRGYDIDSNALIVLGTPYKDEAVIWELAMAIWGFAGLPKTEYSHRKRDNGHFVSKTMCHDDAHLKPIEQFVVSADLVQAIGRVRPLQNPATVFVISNAPICDWDIDQFTASELFDLRLPLRKDAADNYTMLCQVINEKLDQGGWVTLEDVIGKMAKRTAQRWWKKFQEEHHAELIIEHGQMCRKRCDDT
jgi:hypothetical protein